MSTPEDRADARHRVRRLLWIWTLASVATCVASTGCRRTIAEQPVTPVTILTAATDGVFHTIGTALASVYNRRLPGVRARAELRPVETPNVDAIQRGTTELAIATGGEAYLAYKRGTTAEARAHTKLRAIASLFLTAVKIVARRDSGIHRVADLRGQSVAVGPLGSPAERVSGLILDAYGVGRDDVRAVFEAGPDITNQMRQHRIAAVFVFTPFRSALVTEIMQSVDVRLIPIERDKIALIQNQAPFLKSMAIPAGTYAKQSDDVSTVGVDVLLLCRDDVSEELVYQLTRTLFEAAQELAAAHPAARDIDADRAAAVPIPLHPGAARYYRERELLR